MVNIKPTILHFGILGAMPEEIGMTISNLRNVSIKKSGDLQIFSGEFKKNLNPNIKLILSVAWSGWGKVSAARAASKLASLENEGKNIDLIIFTGVAGSADISLKQWDLVISNALIQHDMDASPLYEKFIIPGLKKDKIIPSEKLVSWVSNAFINHKNNNNNWVFGKIIKGLIATGDKFVANMSILNELKKSIPNLKAVEMEGAAVAQVAEQEKIPWIVIRVISDSADANATSNFEEFIEKYQNYSCDLIDILLSSITNEVIEYIIKKRIDRK